MMKRSAATPALLLPRGRGSRLGLVKDSHFRTGAGRVGRGRLQRMRRHSSSKEVERVIQAGGAARTKEGRQVAAWFIQGTTLVYP